MGKLPYVTRTSSLLDLFFCSYTGTLYNIYILNQSMLWIFLFLFFFSFLVGGGQELRDYSDLDYTCKIKGHIAWPSLKDTNSNAYWADLFWKKNYQWNQIQFRKTIKSFCFRLHLLFLSQLSLNACHRSTNKEGKLLNASRLSDQWKINNLIKSL